MEEGLTVTQIQDALSVLERDYPTGVPASLVRNLRSKSVIVEQPTTLKAAFVVFKGDFVKEQEFLINIATKGLALSEDDFEIIEGDERFNTSNVTARLLVLGGRSSISRILRVNEQIVIECPSFLELKNSMDKKKEFWAVLKKAKLLIN